MIFRQLREPISSTYTYLLACPHTRHAALIDPVIEDLATYEELMNSLGLRLQYTLETHVHADHVTASDALRKRLGSRIAVAAVAGVEGADQGLAHGDMVAIGDLHLQVRATPGHTDGCVCFVMEDRVFTGDALLIGGCGRTDFQHGSAPTLYRSIAAEIFTLPPDTLVFPAHDYKGRTVSTIREEILTNARLGCGNSEDEFVAIMADLKRADPKQIDRAVPANMRCGRED